MSNNQVKNQTRSFIRYDHRQSREQIKIRESLVPNKIIFQNYQTFSPTNRHIKKKKMPIFTTTFQFSPNKKKVPNGNIFTNRGIVTASSLNDKQAIHIVSKKQIKVHTKNETSLSLFNRLILTPFNFILHKNFTQQSRSVPSLNQKRIRIFTPNKTSMKIPPEHNPYKKKFSRSSRFGSTWSNQTRRPKTQQKKQQQLFSRWETITVEDELQMQ